VLDNFSSGSRENLAGVAAHLRLTVIRGDVVTADEAAAEARRADFTFNLACPASPVRYQRDPLGTWKTAVLGTMRLAEATGEGGGRFIQASTSEVYGDPAEHPQRESYWGHVNPIGPRACYDEGKRAAETFLADLARTRGGDIRVARIFNTYGPHMAAEDGRVVSSFVAQALAGRDLTVFGDGSHSRSFCYVADMVEGLLRLGASAAGAAPVNLGNPAETSVRDLAELVLKLTGSKSRIVHRPLPEDDPSRRRPDISRAAELLGWQPVTGLEQGLRATIAWFRGGGDRAAYALDALGPLA
jgi:UDP-glucuronate decarboxylase